MLYLIDTSIYVFRAWQTLSPSLVNSHGEQANAQTGFAHFLADVLTHHTPPPLQHCVCAFDECGRSGIRHRLYAGYKAGRPPAPDELRTQFKRCKQVAQAFGVACHGSTQVEADDIIGRFALLARRRRAPVTIISADKDLAQYIGPDDSYWDFARNKRSSATDIAKRFRVQPAQIADWLALCGDKSDNIPGIPGVGEATAARLLKRWNDIDTLFANADQVGGMQFRGARHVGEMLPRFEAQVRLARQLTGLIQDDSLPDSLDALLWQPADESRIESDLLATGLDDHTASMLARQVSGSRAPASTAGVDVFER